MPLPISLTSDLCTFWTAALLISPGHVGQEVHSDPWPSLTCPVILDKSLFFSEPHYLICKMREFDSIRWLSECSQKPLGASTEGEVE